MVELRLRQDRRRPEYYVLEDITGGNLETFGWQITRRPQIWRPPTDVYETDDAVIVRVEIAGMREEDLHVTLDGQHLTIRGIRADLPERRAYHQLEIRFGEFGTEFELPIMVVVEETQATYNNGFLRLVLPKARPRQIQVE